MPTLVNIDTISHRNNIKENKMTELKKENFTERSKYQRKVLLGSGTEFQVSVWLSVKML